MPSPADYEKLGVFYLGTQDGGAPVLYDSRHLVTHGVIVGMTGSGKTGLASVLLEEAAIDGIPTIALDPKGDLGNLLLTFPELRAGDFAPWAPPGESAEAVAQRARDGLAASGQDGARIARFAGSVERKVFTPGARFGTPLSVLRGLQGSAPPSQSGATADVESEDDLRERAVSVTTGLLSLVGVTGDPLRSPAHTLVANVLAAAWRTRAPLDLAALLRTVQSPPFPRLGLMDVDTVIAPKERQSLALAINNAFASPALAAFLEGEPLDPARLLYAPDGRPRLSVISIAHLADAERMFFVTLLLGELLAWMRKQSGTPSLRALFFMDEVLGFFPPVAAPPSKAPMLALLKQARAFGLGLVLATQNPVDLDYKALSNAGTWMLGRLQTDRDRARVLDGLEGAAQAQGAALDRAALDAKLAALRPREFLLHDVHAAGPVAFQTRWSLSYLRGPLSRDELTSLSAAASAAAPPAAEPGSAPVARPAGPATSAPAAAPASTSRPVLPAEAGERFLAPRADASAPVVLVPHVYVRASVRYVHAKAGLDAWLTPCFSVPFAGDAPDFAAARFLGMAAPESSTTAPSLPFAAVPTAAQRAASYGRWTKLAATHLYKDRPFLLFSAPALGLFSRLDEPRDAFVARVAQGAREARDETLGVLRAKWGPKLERAERRAATLTERLAAAEGRKSEDSLATAMSAGAGVLDVLFGWKRSAVSAARSTVTRARKASVREGAITRLRAQLDEARAELDQLRREAETAVTAAAAASDPARVAVEELRVTARKGDLGIDELALAWVPT